MTRVLRLSPSRARAGVSFSQGSLKTCAKQVGDLGRRRQWKEAFKLFQHMPQQHAVPNVVTYNAVISACEKGKRPEQALEIFASMQQQGVVSGVITYNALISAFEKGK